MKRFAIGSGIALGISLLVYFALLPFEQSVLENTLEVLPITGVKQTFWIETFFMVGIYCLVISAVATFLWQIYGQFGIYLGSNIYEISRGVWWAFLLIPLFIIFIIGFFLNFATQDAGRYVASVFYSINGVIIYYVSTLLSSPTNVKFAPVGASKLLR